MQIGNYRINKLIVINHTESKTITALLKEDLTFFNVSLEKVFPGIQATRPLFRDDMFIEAAVSDLTLSPSIRASSPLFRDDMFIEEGSPTQLLVP